MSRRRIGQERFGFAANSSKQSSLDELTKLIDWTPIDRSRGYFLCGQGRACLAAAVVVQGHAAVDLV